MVVGSGPQVDRDTTVYKILTCDDCYFTEDLYGRNQIEPLNFYIPYGVDLPLACQKKEIAVTIFSRLLRRSDKTTIDEESLHIYFNLKKRLQWYRA